MEGLTGYYWSQEKMQSFVCMSDDTDHKAPAVFASIQPILKQFVQDGTHKINIVSDSPTSQYRNKHIFYLMKEFTMEFQVPIEWIYLEANHGKGIPDDIGAVVKQAISDIVPFNPETPQYSCSDILKLGLVDAIPSINVSTFTSSHIADIKLKLPNLKSIAGTMKCPEVSTEIAASSDGDVNFSIIMKELSNLPAMKCNLQINNTTSAKLERKCIFSELRLGILPLKHCFKMFDK